MENAVEASEILKEEPHNVYQNLQAGSIHQLSKISKAGPEPSDYRSENHTYMTEQNELTSGVGEASYLNRMNT